VNMILNQLRALGSHFFIVMQLIQRLRAGKPVCTRGRVESHLTEGLPSKDGA
jgi:hypothetical protein